jgi:hypothetical protein
VTQRQADETKSVGILVVDDFEPWHDFTANTLKKDRVSKSLETYPCVHVHEPRWRLEDRGAGLGPHVVACYVLGFAWNLILPARKVSAGHTLEVSLIAMAGKVIIEEPNTVSSLTLFGIAALILALAVAFYFERQAPGKILRSNSSGSDN